MDQTQAKPRRRRRWLILAFVLAVAATFSWWHWPRWDARFVGRWQCGDRIIYFRDDGIVDGFVQFDGSRLLLLVHGLARFKAIGNRLQVLPDQATGWQSVINDIKRLTKRTPKDDLFYDGEVVSFTSTEVILRGRCGPGSKPTTYTIRRVPE